MAYFSLHAYDADVWLQEFKGINQADAEINADPRFAVEAENVETPLGVLQPHAGGDCGGPARVQTSSASHAAGGRKGRRRFHR